MLYISYHNKKFFEKQNASRMYTLYRIKRNIFKCRNQRTSFVPNDNYKNFILTLRVGEQNYVWQFNIKIFSQQ